MLLVMDVGNSHMVLGLYEGGGRTCSRLSLTECNDDGCPGSFDFFSFGSFGSLINRPTLAGTHYTIRGGGYFVSGGVGSLSGMATLWPAGAPARVSTQSTALGR